MTTRQPLVFLKGFSLVELLVVIFIISLTAGILLVSYGDDRAAKELEASSREFAGALREAQNYALTGKLIGSGTIPCGYQVDWTGSSYRLIYYYRTPSTPSCAAPVTTILSSTVYTKNLKKGATFMNSSALTFILPHGALNPGLPGNTPWPIILTQGNVSHVVCIANNGQLSDYPGSTCP